MMGHTHTHTHTRKYNHTTAVQGCLSPKVAALRSVPLSMLLAYIHTYITYFFESFRV